MVEVVGMAFCKLEQVVAGVLLWVARKLEPEEEVASLLVAVVEVVGMAFCKLELVEEVASLLVRFPRAGRRLALECKGRRELDCKTHPSSRDESRP